MTEDAPPGRSGALTDVGRTLGVAAFGGAVAFAALVVLGQVLALAQYLLLGGYGLWSWAKIGLLTALLSLRADVVATVQGPPALQTATRSETIPLRVVPMVLTIGFLWLAGRAGRRAARAMPGRPPFVTAGTAAVGAGVPVALFAGICASLVTLTFPSLGLDLHVDVWSAALWAGVLAAAGTGTGAYMEAASGRSSAAALRGGLTAYGWALGLIAVGVFVVATLEPSLTRAYVDGLTGLGAPGRALLGLHLLAFPAQSALLLAPASGSCLEVVGDGPILHLCPWYLAASGPAGQGLLPEPARAHSVALDPERSAPRRGDVGRRSSREGNARGESARPRSRGRRRLYIRTAHGPRSMVRRSTVVPDPHHQPDLRAPCMGEDRGHGVDLGNGGWRSRCVALGSALRRARVPEADLGVIRLDRRESTPRGGPTGVIPRESLERP